MLELLVLRQCLEKKQKAIFSAQNFWTFSYSSSLGLTIKICQPETYKILIPGNKVLKATFFTWNPSVK